MALYSRKNVRQSLGLNNRVNKGIKSTIYGSDSGDFFFLHNGITALCSNTEIADGTLTVRGVNVVNGCQSLNTILSCSERVRRLNDAYVMFRFYEIPERERADRISICTNSQSAVKPRDLRSNDRSVLATKRAYEQKYPSGYFVTKRGEEAPANKEQTLVVDLLELGKYSWLGIPSVLTCPIAKTRFLTSTSTSFSSEMLSTRLRTSMRFTSG